MASLKRPANKPSEKVLCRINSGSARQGLNSALQKKKKKIQGKLITPLEPPYTVDTVAETWHLRFAASSTNSHSTKSAHSLHSSKRQHERRWQVWLGKALDSTSTGCGFKFCWEQQRVSLRVVISVYRHWDNVRQIHAQTKRESKQKLQVQCATDNNNNNDNNTTFV